MSALHGIVIVETAERPAGEYCAKLMADLGAEVIKVERPGGAPTRGMGPFRTGPDGARHSALFAYLNSNKKSVVLDLTDPADRATLDRLLARADALVDDHDENWAQTHGLTQAGIAAAHPSLVHCAITPFGQGAPAQWQTARPINVINAGGWAYHSPSETVPSKPPLKGAGRFLPDYEAGIDAAMCVMACVYRRRKTGKGQFIDLSEVEVQLNRIDCVLDRLLAGDVEPSNERTAYDMGGPGTSFACKDGHIYLFMTTKGHWNALLDLMGRPAWGAEFPEDWLEFQCTRERVAQFRELFSGWSATQEKVAVSEAAQKLGVAIVPVNTAADLPKNEQLVHRGFFQPFDHPRFGEVLYPMVPYKFSATPARIVRAEPTLGEHAAELEDK
jgi:crotonobetainyl-CoA:carnitine CoA-transferase CaiB-like acyl-CoA transferase